MWNPVFHDAMRGRTQTRWWVSKRGDRLVAISFISSHDHQCIALPWRAYSVVTPQTRPKCSSATLFSPWPCRFWNRRRRVVRPPPHVPMAWQGLSGIPSCTQYVLYCRYWTYSTLPQAPVRELLYLNWIWLNSDAGPWRLKI